MVRVYGYTEEFELYSGKFSKSTIFMFSWIELHVVLQNFTLQYSESRGTRMVTSILLHSHYNLCPMPCYVVSSGLLCARREYEWCTKFI